MSLFFLLGHFSIWRQVSFRIIEQFRFWEIEKKSTAYAPFSLFWMSEQDEVNSMSHFVTLKKRQYLNFFASYLQKKLWKFGEYLKGWYQREHDNNCSSPVKTFSLRSTYAKTRKYGILRLPVDLIKFFKEFLSCKQVWFFIILVSYWRCSGVFIANFKHISRIVLVYPILTLKK